MLAGEKRRGSIIEFPARECQPTWNELFSSLVGNPSSPSKTTSGFYYITEASLTYHQTQ
jgi:hypothetical protein